MQAILSWDLLVLLDRPERWFGVILGSRLAINKYVLALLEPGCTHCTFVR